MSLPLAIAARIDAVNRGVARAVGWLLLLMVVVGAYNAVARYLERDAGLQLSSNALSELQWYMFGLAFLLGAPHALQRGAHVRVDVLYGGLPERAQHRIDLWGTLLFLIPGSACAIWLSLDFVAASWLDDEWSNDPGGLPRWPIKPAIPAAFALLLLQGVSEAIKRWAVLRGAASPEELGLRAEPARGGDER
ncbi:MAG: TRAP transporter small permease subunit [Planctomycetota bacterium]|nr:TRAP transporter small permease subunit [Planctomycetota bacterium]